MTDAAAVAERRYRADEQPTVVCVMLVNGRPEMVKRAIASFRSQTYERKRLLIWDTTPTGCPIDELIDSIDDVEIILPGTVLRHGATIGSLRNEANNRTSGDLIAHFDSDDWSHPRRLEEQVALLLASGKQCVGYRELLFWDTRTEVKRRLLYSEPSVLRPEGVDVTEMTGHVPRDEAWLYRNDDARWVSGASMLYRREAWEACPFDDAPHEDQRWWMRNAEKCLGVSAMQESGIDQRGGVWTANPHWPRMIAQMHGGNTEAYARAAMLAGSQVWRRATEWDKFCERTMAL